MRILDRRFRGGGSEIDLVALDGEVIVFVEVKTRRGVGHGEPWEAVVARKRARIARAALQYLADRDLLERRARFDVVEVLIGASGRPAVRHIPDAFRTDAPR